MRAQSLGGWLVVLSCAACSGQAPDMERVPGANTASSAGAAGAAGTSATIPIGLTPELGADCDETRDVAADSEALLVRDPEVLQRFSLRRVLEQLIATSSMVTTPTELLQRLFDSENAAEGAVFADGVHCDDPGNQAFLRPGSGCGRVEGKLARSQGLLEPGHPDSFVPVALVNRFDLTPSNLATCGEYRIVYAKLSGKTDPNDRAFLIFEAAPLSPSRQLAACRPLTELWAALPSANAAARADKLEALFFEGLGTFPPIVHAQHYGFAGSCDYAGSCGQVRLGQGMQAPWEFRQFQLMPVGTSTTNLSFVPVADGGSLLPELFTMSAQGPAAEAMYLLGDELESLAASDAAHIKARGFPGYETGMSALEGEGRPDFAARLAANPDRAGLEAGLTAHIANLDPAACPPDDPITLESVLARATAISCAGCHAPERLLPPERNVGCGVVWPNSLGEAHIDEQGNLSEALTNVFLPHRADILATYLRACDISAVRANLQRVLTFPIPK